MIGSHSRSVRSVERTALHQLGYNFRMPNHRRPDLDWRVIHAGV
jgi:hypothetical protein